MLIIITIKNFLARMIMVRRIVLFVAMILATIIFDDINKSFKNQKINIMILINLTITVVMLFRIVIKNYLLGASNKLLSKNNLITKQKYI